MGMTRLARLLILCLMLAGCGSSFEVDSNAIKSTYPTDRMWISEEGGYRIARGGIQLIGAHAQYNAVNKNIRFYGTLDVRNLKNQRVRLINVDLNGHVDKDGFAVLRASSKTQEKLAAKATCLIGGADQGWGCEVFFIDIYYAHGDMIYHHQVEVKKDGLDWVPPQGDSHEHETSPEDDEHLEHDGVDIESGPFVGKVTQDIQDILGVAPHPSLADPTPPLEGPSQAINQVDNGRLENAWNALEFQTTHAPSGFYVMRPQRQAHYATREMIYLLGILSGYTKSELPNYPVPLGDISRKNGGKLGSHKSHQSGLDADIAFYFKSAKLRQGFTPAVSGNKVSGEWMAQEQWELFKKLQETKLVDRIFIHTSLKKVLCKNAIQNKEVSPSTAGGTAYEVLRRLRVDSDHHNHFHLRSKCSKAQVRCRQMAEPPMGTGCF